MGQKQSSLQGGAKNNQDSEQYRAAQALPVAENHSSNTSHLKYIPVVTQQIVYAPAGFLECLPHLLEWLPFHTLKQLPSICQQISSRYYFTCRSHIYQFYSPKKFMIKIDRSYDLDEYQDELMEWLPESTRGLHLIYDSNQNGKNSHDFHRKCDSFQNTLILIKSEKGYLFGGFTTQPWMGRTPHGSYVQSPIFYQADPKAFLFTLKNPFGIPPTKYLVDPAKAQYAIKCTWMASFEFGEKRDISLDKGVCGVAFPDTYVDSTGYGNKTFTGEPFFKPVHVLVYQAYPCNEAIIPNKNYDARPWR